MSNNTIFYTILGLWVLISGLHFSTVLGYDPSTLGSWLLPLCHIGAFVCFVPALVKLIRAQTAHYQLTKQRPGLIYLLKQNAPSWLVYLFGALALYVVLNFMLSISQVQGTVELNPETGQALLVYKGEVVREAFEGEAELISRKTLQAFSGHWLMFYGLGLLAFFPKRQV